MLERKQMENTNEKEQLVDKLLELLEATGDEDFIRYSKMIKEQKKKDDLERAVFRMVSVKPDGKKHEKLTDMMKTVQGMYMDLINSWKEEGYAIDD